MLVSGEHVGVVMELEGWGVGQGGVGVGCGLEDIYSFTPGHLPTQTLTHLITKTRLFKYSRLSLSRTPRDSMKQFEISVLRHIRFADSGKQLIEQPP